MATVSIIVPIYNAEAYLRMCVESIRMQHMSDFELILVNDGSKDRSLEICNEYAAKDQRIVVLDKPNGGVSSARNLGLEHATGEYLMFVDADDWLAPNALSLCSPYIPEYDIVKYGLFIYQPNGLSCTISSGDPQNKDEVMRLIISRKTIVGPVGMLVRRKIFNDYNIRFNPKFTIGEDWLVVAHIMHHAHKFKFLPDEYAYAYNKLNESSCTNGMTTEKRVQQYDVLNKIRELVGDNYNSSFSYTKCQLMLEMICAIGKHQTIEWFSKVDNQLEMLSYKDILIADYIDKRSRFRLFKLLRKVGKIMRKRSL